MLVITLPFSFDLDVPEVAGDLRWYIMHTAAVLLAIAYCVSKICLPNTTAKMHIKTTVSGYATVLIVALGSLSIFWSISSINTFWFMKHLIAYGIIFGMFVYLRDDKWYRNIMWLIAIGAGFNGLLGVFQFLAVTDKEIASFIPFVNHITFMDYFKQSAPPAGTLSNKNLAGSFLVATLPIILYLLFSTKKLI